MEARWKSWKGMSVMQVEIGLLKDNRGAGKYDEYLTQAILIWGNQHLSVLNLVMMVLWHLKIMIWLEYPGQSRKKDLILNLQSNNSVSILSVHVTVESQVINTRIGYANYYGEYRNSNSLSTWKVLLPKGASTKSISQSHSDAQ